MGVFGVTREIAAECFLCGSPAIDTFGNGYLCDNCLPDEEATDADGVDHGSGTDTNDDGEEKEELGAWCCSGWRRSDTGRRVWPTVLREHAQFMTSPTGEKFGFAPWGDPDHPEGNPDKDARYKWALPDM